jgi:hypothetical protein
LICGYAARFRALSGGIAVSNIRRFRRSRASPQIERHSRSHAHCYCRCLLTLLYH